jgi:hypothetical protein
MLVIRFSVRNNLSVPVENLAVAALAAQTPELLRDIDVRRAYRQGAPGIRVLGQQLQMRVEANTQVQTEISVASDAGGVPAAFAAHLVFYELPELDATVLQRLVQTGSAADEIAAVAALGLDGDARDRWEIRQQWGEGALPLIGFVNVLRAPVPETLTQAQAMVRFISVLALGVLGGSDEMKLLNPLLERADNESLDETLQVIRAGAIKGSPWDAPLGSLLPDTVETFADLVQHALAQNKDLQTEESAAAAVMPSAGPIQGWPDWFEATRTSAPPAADTPTKPAFSPMILVGVTLGLCTLLTFVLLARKRRLQNNEDSS